MVKKLRTPQTVANAKPAPSKAAETTECAQRLTERKLHLNKDAVGTKNDTVVNICLAAFSLLCYANSILD